MSLLVTPADSVSMVLTLPVNFNGCLAGGGIVESSFLLALDGAEESLFCIVLDGWEESPFCLAPGETRACALGSRVPSSLL